mmetsp:Transcript_113888/g.242931  ORF Transcript_113888/g.242931 Transcript_113888/m.242931 type:complete len:211 (-) Transcript_113888:581-1213(-)
MASGRLARKASWCFASTSWQPIESTVASTSMRAPSSWRTSLQRCAVLPKTSACCNCSSVKEQSLSHQLAKASYVMLPPPQAFITLSSSSSDTVENAALSPLTCLSMYSISPLLMLPLPSRSNAWNCIFRASSVVELSITAFLRICKACVSPRLQKRARTVSSTSIDTKFESQLWRYTTSLCFTAMGRLSLKIPKVCPEALGSRLRIFSGY